ncbi:hypothetical protein S245_058431, partial [Arachis hypogaea]
YWQSVAKKTLPGHKLDFPDLIHFPSHVSLRSLKKTSWKNDADCCDIHSSQSIIIWKIQLQLARNASGVDGTLFTSKNKLYDSVTSFSVEHSFPKLRFFYISNNKFSGSLPTSFFQNLQGMKDLSDSTHHHPCDVSFSVCGI